MQTRVKLLGEYSQIIGGIQSNYRRLQSNYWEDISPHPPGFGTPGLRKHSPNKLYLPKQMGEDHLDDLELDGPIALRILNGIARDFTQAK